MRYLAAYEEQNTYSSSGLLLKTVAFFKKKGVAIECVHTDNGSEFTNRFTQSNLELVSLFEKTAADLGILYAPPQWQGRTQPSRRPAPFLRHDSLPTSITALCALYSIAHLTLSCVPILSNMFDNPII